MATGERFDGKTPHGGDYVIAMFNDREGNEVDKKQATHVEIIEYREDGTAICSTFGTIEEVYAEWKGRSPQKLFFGRDTSAEQIYEEIMKMGGEDNSRADNIEQ